MAMQISAKSLLLFTCILLHLVGLNLTVAQPTYNDFTCSGSNYTANSVYERNLNATISSILSTPTNDITFAFFNASRGQSPDKVYTIALCRGDVEPGICINCIENLSIRLRQRYCPSRKIGVAWFEKCMFRYSDDSTINHALDPDPGFRLHNVNDAPNFTEFNQALGGLMSKLKVEAANGTSLLKFATGDILVPNFVTLYGLVQCTPDLSKQQCSSCLDTLESDIYSGKIPSCCSGKVGGVLLASSCNMRYEIYTYYNDSRWNNMVVQAPPPGPLQSTPPPGKDSKSNQTAIIIVVPTVIIVILLASSCIFIIKRRKQKKPKEKFDPDDAEIGNDESLQYDFSTIRVATNNFSDKNKLGQGGFGSVFKGTLQSGEEIAVKRLAKDSGQGELEFKNEVLLVARLQHRNLVRLRGFCFEKTERLLIYEFMHNASLDNFLFDPTKRANLDWGTRSKIISGIARGVLYLHEDSRLRIIHRDLKASNVLLDEEMTPKIADFGMAKLVVRNETQGDTSRIVGTYGYMAPEYAMHGQFSVKSDVFSFGVLVLEIVAGRKNLYFKDGDFVEDLLSSAWKNLRDGTAIDMIDPILREGQSSIQHILRNIHIGLLCVQENIASRPTMASVVLMLNSFSLTLTAPSEPPFFMHSEEPLHLGGYSFVTTNSRQSKSISTSSGLSTNDISGSSSISNKVI